MCATLFPFEQTFEHALTVEGFNSCDVAIWVCGPATDLEAQPSVNSLLITICHLQDKPYKKTRTTDADHFSGVWAE